MTQSQKTILVTGGAGFIGSNLCRRLVQDAHRVISLDNYFTGSSENPIEGVEYRQGDTKDIATLIPERLDTIYHLGEYSRVEKSFEDISLVWDSNVMGTFHVLEFWRNQKCKLIYAGSSTKFADGGMGRDQSPYAFTKATNTELVRNYGVWFDLPYAITYFYNVYGPGERSGAYGTVIEIFRQKRLKGEALTVTMPGTQRRNFTHIEDIIDGLIVVGDKGQGIDFGIGDERSYAIIDIANLFGGPIIMKPSPPGNRTNSVIDTSKTRSLGWAPKHDVELYIQSSLSVV